MESYNEYLNRVLQEALSDVDGKEAKPAEQVFEELRQMMKDQTMELFLPTSIHKKITELSDDSENGFNKFALSCLAKGLYAENDITIIAAYDDNKVIGKDNDIPWRMSDDLKNFKKETIGKTVVMGSMTFESLKQKPLPNRNNIVLSRNRDRYIGDNVKTYTDMYDVLNDYSSLVVIGGSQIYKMFLPFAKKMILTKIGGKIDGDRHFPNFNKKEWKIIDTKAIAKSDKNEFNGTIYYMTRK